jgi:hypothetical protein
MSRIQEPVIVCNVDVQNLFLGFAGIVTAVSMWNIWGGDMFPAEKDPKGGMSKQCRSWYDDGFDNCLDPETWTESELRRWLQAVSITVDAT